jgi:hypothetical protein
MAHRIPDQPGSRQETDPTEAAGRGPHASPWHLLLLVPLVGTLVPAFYNRRTPLLGAIPFFYWYQMLWIGISVACTIVVYRATRSHR